MSDNIETHPTIVKVEAFAVAETERTDDAIDVEKLHTDRGLITASQVRSDDCPTEVLELGKRAATHLEKAAKCDENAFRERFFPHVARSRAYELLAIATNKKSIEVESTVVADRARLGETLQTGLRRENA